MMKRLRHYTSVGATTTSTDTYVVADGKTVWITCFGGNAPPSEDTKVEIYWDGVLRFVTHGDDDQCPHLECTGDGSKAIEVKLVNNSNSAKSMGGWWDGEEYET